MRDITVWDIVLGLALLGLGVFLLIAFLAAATFRWAFGGAETSIWLFLIPVVLLVGGPGFFWVYRPSQRRKAREPGE